MRKYERVQTQAQAYYILNSETWEEGLYAWSRFY